MMPFWEGRLTETSNRVTHSYIWRARQRSIFAPRAAQSWTRRRQMTYYMACALARLRCGRIRSTGFDGYLRSHGVRLRVGVDEENGAEKKKKRLDRFGSLPMMEVRKQRWEVWAPW